MQGFPGRDGGVVLFGPAEFVNCWNQDASVPGRGGEQNSVGMALEDADSCWRGRGLMIYT